jgi:hypothetical protein
VKTKAQRCPSDPAADATLRSRAQALIRARTLPNPLPARRWGGPGNGTRCPVCTSVVDARELCVEIEFLNGPEGQFSAHFHVPCLLALEEELGARPRDEGA